MSERAALITASDKTYVPELAEALHAHEYEIVSLGETAKRIESETDVPVTRTEAFLKAANIEIDQFWMDAETEDEEALPLRSRREIVAVHLSQCLSLRRNRLEKLGWPAIDFAYVNLMMPDFERDEERNYQWLKIDKGGFEMVHAAIEGGRQLLVQPYQILDYIAALNGDPESDERSLNHHQQAFEATKSLTVYTQRAYSALSFIATHTTEMRLPPQQ